ncbi:MAG: hypothetical protein AAF517_12565, partial [Planctomycetota bacterium]
MIALLAISICAPLSGANPIRLSEVDWVEVRRSLELRVPGEWIEARVAGRRLGGAEFEQRAQAGVSLLEFEAGDWVDIRVEAGETVAMIDSGGESAISFDELALWFSSGDRLFRRVWPSREEERGLYWSPPRGQRGRLRLALPTNSKSGALFGVFLVGSPRNAAPYKIDVTLSAERVSLRLDRDASDRRFYRFRAGVPVEVDVSRLSRIEWRTRRVYGTESSRAAFRYRLRIDEAKTGRGESIDIDTTADWSRVFVNGQLETLGEERVVYFDVPQGISTLRFASDTDALGQMRARSSRPFLLQEFNLLDPEASAPAHVARAPQVERRAKRLAVRSGVSEGVQAARAEISILASRLDHGKPELEAIGRRLSRFASYRTLAPLECRPGDEAELAAFASRGLPRERARELRTSTERLVDDAARAMGRGRFYSLDGVDSLEFDLPRRQLGSLVRLAVAARPSTRARIFWSIDGGEPRPLRLVRESDLPGDFEAPRAEVAEEIRRTLRGGAAGVVPGDPLQLWITAPARFLRAAVATIEIPAGSKRLSVWRELGHGEVRISVALRVSKPSAMSGDELRGAFDSVEKGVGVYDWFRECVVRHRLGEADASPAEAQLRNYWFPLLGLLSNHASEFDRVDRSFATRDVERAEQGIAAESYVELAQRSAERGDHYAALRQWGEALRAGAAIDKAQLGRARTLFALGEPYLATSILESLLGASKVSRSAWEEAFDLLAEFAAERGDLIALERVLARVAFSSPDRSTLVALARALEVRGETALVVQIAEIIGLDEIDADSLLSSAMTERRWDLFDRRLALVGDESRRKVWEGRRLLSLGRFTEAAQVFRVAGPAGVAISRAVDRGLEIRERLLSENLSLRADAIPDWHEWTLSQPGDLIYRIDGTAVTRSLGTRRVLAIAKNRSLLFHRATPLSPGELRLFGPARYRVEVRPLHDTVDTVVDSWLRLTSGEWLRPIPISNNTTSSGLELDSSDDSFVGRAVSFEIDVPEGCFLYSFAPEAGEVLFRVHRERPKLALAVLPPFVPITLGAVIRGDFGATRRSADDRVVPLELNLEGSESLLLDVITLVPSRRKIDLTPRVQTLAKVLREPILKFLHARYLSDGDVGGDLDTLARELARGETRWVLESPMSTSVDTAKRRLEALAFVAEKYPGVRTEAWTLGERVFRRSPESLALRSPYKRLARDLVWRRVHDIKNEFGFKYVGG